MFLTKYVYYGNDDDEADYYTIKVLNDFSDIVSEFDIGYPIRFPAGSVLLADKLSGEAKGAPHPFGKKTIFLRVMLLPHPIRILRAQLRSFALIAKQTTKN